MSDTNHTQKVLTRETNDLNYQIFKEQQAYNWDVMNYQNEYNKAANQRQRLEEAGMNPYLMMSGADAGTASSGLGVNPPVMQTPNIQGEYEDISTSLNNLNQTLNTASSSIKALNESNGVQIENQYKASKMQGEVNNLIADTSKKVQESKTEKERSNYQSTLNDIIQFQKDHQEESWLNQQNLSIAQKNLFDQQVTNYVAEKALIDAKTNEQLTNNKYLDERNLKELVVLGSQISLNFASAKASEASAKASLAQALLNTNLAKKAGIDANTADQIAGSIVSTYYNDAAIKELRAKNMFEYGAEEAPTTWDGKVDGSFGYGPFKLGAGASIRGYKKR